MFRVMGPPRWRVEHRPAPSTRVNHRRLYPYVERWFPESTWSYLAGGRYIAARSGFPILYIARLPVLASVSWIVSRIANGSASAQWTTSPSRETPTRGWRVCGRRLPGGYRILLGALPGEEAEHRDVPDGRSSRWAVLAAEG